MYVDIVPNRNSRPTALLRESYREGGKVLKRTVANISHLSDEKIIAVKNALMERSLLLLKRRSLLLNGGTCQYE